MKCYRQMKYINNYYMFKQKVGVHKSCVIWSLCLKNLQSYVVTIILFLNLELWCNIFVIITKMAQLAAHSGVHILWVMKPLQKSPRHILLLFSWVYCVKIFIHVECCDDHKIGWLVVLSVSYKRKVTGYYRSLHPPDFVWEFTKSQRWI